VHFRDPPPQENNYRKFSPLYRVLKWLLVDKGDGDGAIAEYCEALRLNPKDELAHEGLGSVYTKKRDWDGAIAEYREMVRLNSNNEGAHFGLGVALDQKGDLRGALEEFCAAYMIDPKSAGYKMVYERLLRRVNQ
jgi:Flp pilus assembly protein TadD